MADLKEILLLRNEEINGDIFKFFLDTISRSICVGC